MTFAAVTLLGMTVGQPLGSDYYPMNTRTIRLPIEYKKDRKSIQQVLLYVARNGENTWYQEGFVTPDKDAFVYIAKDDGLYWFKMVLVDLKGNKDPADLTRDPPDLKIVIDTTPPQVRVTNARRSGDEILVEWAVDDKFLNEAETKVHFRRADDPKYWTEVTLPTKTGVKFRCGTTGAVTVKITAADVAGNRAEVTKDFPAADAGQLSTSLSPPAGPTGPVTPPAQLTPMGGTGGTTNPGNNGTGAGAGAITPPAPEAGPGPNGPVAPGPITPVGPPSMVPITPAPAPPVQPITPAPVPPVQPIVPAPAPAVPPAPYQPHGGGNTNPAPGGMQPLATVDPKAQPAPAPITSTASPPGTWSGASVPEGPRAQVINYPRFDLGFDLEQRGPSGISRVDLWVTRDEGQSWHKWSHHDGKGGAVRVALDVRENTQLEGNYGFRLVPVSGAGLSEREPVAGDTPDLRIVLDVTAPQLDLFPPVSDPNNPDTLILQWKATDRNFGEDPITLEWSESSTGPWKPVVTTGNDPVVQATALTPPLPRRLANTGQYGWRVPAGVPARVYLKASARDAGGNVKEVVTREPILVDLTKPRAKISGIVPPVTPRP
jgi:hypothetical protein